MGGTAFLVFPAVDVCFISIRGFKEGISRKVLSPTKIQTAPSFYFSKKEKKTCYHNHCACFQVHRIRRHMPASNTSTMEEPFPSHLLQYFIPKYVWGYFFFFWLFFLSIFCFVFVLGIFLWGPGVKRLSKYAHESLWRKAAQQVVQLRYRNCNRRCRRAEPELGC